MQVELMTLSANATQICRIVSGQIAMRQFKTPPEAWKREKGKVPMTNIKQAPGSGKDQTGCSGEGHGNGTWMVLHVQYGGSLARKRSEKASMMQRYGELGRHHLDLSQPHGVFEKQRGISRWKPPTTAIDISRPSSSQRTPLSSLNKARKWWTSRYHKNNFLEAPRSDVITGTLP